MLLEIQVKRDDPDPTHPAADCLLMGLSYVIAILTRFSIVNGRSFLSNRPLACFLRIRHNPLQSLSSVL